MNVLIVFGTRYGSSEEIAKEMAKTLRINGLSVKVHNLKNNDWPDVNNFDGVLVGSGIKAGQWTKHSIKFLKNNKAILNKKVLGLFVSCATAMGDKEKAKNDYLSFPGLKPKILGPFGPLFDFSDKSRMGFLDKAIIKIILKKRAGDNKNKIDFNGRNDYRDWKQIKAFAIKFSKMIS